MYSTQITTELSQTQYALTQYTPTTFRQDLIAAALSPSWDQVHTPQNFIKVYYPQSGDLFNQEWAFIKGLFISMIDLDDLVQYYYNSEDFNEYGESQRGDGLIYFSDTQLIFAAIGLSSEIQDTIEEYDLDKQNNYIHNIVNITLDNALTAHHAQLVEEAELVEEVKGKALV